MSMSNVDLKLGAATIATFFVLLLSACGGGGGNSSAPSTSTSTSTTSAVPGVVDVLLSSSTLNSSGAPIDVTVTVKDSGNVAISGATVSLASTSGNLTVNSTTTNSSGAITATLAAGSDKSLRSITLTATSGSISRTAQVQVVGTKLNVSGVSSVQLGGTANLTIVAADSTGAGIPGVSITATSSLGNSLGAIASTDSTGSTTMTYSPTISGSDTLTFSAVGTTKTYLMNVSGSDFVFTSPAANSTVTIGSSQVVTVRYRVAGTPQVGQTVSFSTTRGTLTASTAVTNGSGEASVSVSSTSAGTGTITANVGSGSGASVATLPLSFEATTATSIVVQASPSAISPNASGSTANRSTISVILRDATGNPVANKQVNFSLVADVSPGTIGASATTDSSGRASVQYTAGPGTTATNGVQVRATVQGTGLSGDTYLTVNNSALFISIAFGSKLAEYSVGGNPVGYEQTVAVYVTDSNGASVANQDITVSAIPSQYRKGSLVRNASGSTAYWNLATTPNATCANEDTNRNGSRDSGEDVNGNNALDPGNVISLMASTIRTDSTGWGSTTFRYAKRFAVWTELELVAKATVSGTESARTAITWLPVTVTDNDSTNGPAVDWSTSPFGTAGACADPN